MDAPRVLVLGDSFIRRLRLFVKIHSPNFALSFNLPDRAVVNRHGIGGRTVAKTIQHDLHVVESFRPHIVILQLGSNDLISCEPEQVGSAIDDLVHLLHDVYGVSFICVCQTIHRKGASHFNRNVGILKQYLRVVLDSIPHALFWGYRGFWRALHNFYARFYAQ